MAVRHENAYQFIYHEPLYADRCPNAGHYRCVFQVYGRHRKTVAGQPRTHKKQNICHEINILV